MYVGEDSKKLLTGVAVSVLVLLVIRFTLVGGVSRAEERSRKRFEKLSGELEASRKSPYDLAEITHAYEQASGDLQGQLEGLKDKLSIDFHDWTKIPPEYSQSPAAYFRFMFARQQQDLYIECARRDVKLSDPDLGILPKGGELRNEEAQENLNRLSITHRLILLLAQAGVSEIESVSPGRPEPTGAKGHPPFIREYPVKLVVRTGLDPLMQFLHSVRKPGKFFLVIRSISMGGADPFPSAGRSGPAARLGGDEMSVSITAAAMRFLSEEEVRSLGEEARPKAAPGGGPRPGKYKPGVPIGI